MSGAKRLPHGGTKPKLIALSVAACFGLSSTQVIANPTGGTVSSGSASFSTSGNTLTITNSANAIINWQSFSIGVNEITRFLQSSSSSAVLNRVVGANGVIPQSVIDGVLSSNGRVFLLNSSGIIIGKGARIDVAGFVASSLNLSDADFKAGRMRFTQTPGAGKVSNAGEIDTSSGGPGGRVFLIAPDVENSGIIRSPQGEIILAAGKSVELVSENSPFVTVNIVADTERVVNLGRLIADSGHIGMFGALVRQGGVVQADSAVAGPNGEIRLVATRDLTLDAGSLTTANGPSGGKITLQAQGGTNLVYGTVEAKGSAGEGGTVQALGVRVGVLGNGVIDASGETGGGTVLVGGDAHGANPDIQNAQQTLIGSDGVIRADAATTGDGGRVVVWSDAYTQVYGTISARGGAQSGNGGFVETSSAGAMDLSGVRVDTRAPNGRWGTWLLDPANIFLEPNSYAGGGDPLANGANFVTNPGTDTHITRGTVESGFQTNGTVQLQATNDVNFRTDVTLVYSGATAGLFEVRAQRNIDLAADGVVHTITANGNVVLSANDVGPYGAGGPALSPTGTGSIIGGGNIFADYGGVPGGNITLSGYGVTVGTLETMGGINRSQVGDILITALAGGVKTGTITTRGSSGSDFTGGAQPAGPTAGGNAGSINISVGYGGTVSTGTIDASGGRGGNGGYASGQLFSGAAGGTGGAISIGGGAYAPISIATGSITTTGGAGGAGGSGGYVSASGLTQLDLGSGGDGGNGGAVNLTGGSVTTGAIKASGGAGGAGGSNNTVTLNGTTDGFSSGVGFLTVGLGGNGGFGGGVSISGTSITLPSIASSGGAGGAGGSGNKATSIVNGVSAQFTGVSGSASAGSGGSGGSGGQILLNGTGAVRVNGAIDAYGGAGGIAGSNNTADAGIYGGLLADSANASALAGIGGSGGSGTNQVNITGDSVHTGAISVGSGAGGTGGANAKASAYASSGILVSSYGASVNAGSGGSGGFRAGNVTINATNDIVTGDIHADAALGGAGGTGSTGAASGYGSSLQSLSVTLGVSGQVQEAGSVNLVGPYGVTTGLIDVSGSGPGSVFVNATTGDIVTDGITALGGTGFGGGNVQLTTVTGRIVVNGNIDVRGSDGAPIQVDVCHDGCIVFAYAGSAGGTVALQRTGQGDPVGGAPAIQVGDIVAYGGNGFAPQNAAGGNGGNGGAVLVASLGSGNGGFYGLVSVGRIDTHGGNGAAGAAGFAGGAGGTGGTITVAGSDVRTGALTLAGGSGGAGGAYGLNGVGAGGAGGSGGQLTIGAYVSIATGDIIVDGGDGGNGGATNVAAGVGGAGGAGGSSGFIDLFTQTSNSSVSTGNINISGGRGGKGGDAALGYGGIGGAGGSSDDVSIDPNTASIGSIVGKGGAGGAGGYGGISGGAGGAGGTGAAVDISGFLYGGPIAVGNIDISGGAGGAGGGSGGANLYGAAGGAGGSGGQVDMFAGSIDLTKGGNINVSGGAGGAGGSGASAGYGGAGGFGGGGGSLDLFVPGQTSAYGPILVAVAQAPFLSYGGGAGGAGGLIGGLAGAAGGLGSASVFGEVVVNATSSAGPDAVVQGVIVAGTLGNPPPLDDQGKKDKDDKQKKGVAACK